MRDPGRGALRCSQLAFAPLHHAGAPLTLLRRLVPLLVPFLTACDAGPKTFRDVERGRLHLDASDAEALRGLLAAAGLETRHLGMEGELSETPNWVQVDGAGRVWSLGLAAAPELDSLEPLAGLLRLSRLRVRDARLTGLEGLSGLAELRFLSVFSSGLESLGGLEGCDQLRVLDLRDNRLDSLAGLAELPGLRVLDLANNEISRVEDLAGRRLESLDLSGNRLETASGIEDLPALERLNLARNRLASLDGLRGLPSLRELLADDNRLVDAAAVDALLALELVNLNGNRLERFPALVDRLPQHLWQDNPGWRRHLAERTPAPRPPG